MSHSPYLDARPDDDEYAIGVANRSYEWYRSRAIITRRAHRITEVFLVLVSAAIPLSAVLLPNDATLPAIFGACVVVFSGFRSAFNWHDNYLRFSHSREAVEAERRRYKTWAEPYGNPEARNQVLVTVISKIEQNEMSNWITLASGRGEAGG
ncbi:DUF4231 domain-containing protein, partial [Amycolatopsis magusensis]|uniref:DUF4231 domain-containing protein n=1 Tax=Amycolatopsis magusensis TaxID=882444 RepID=UPI0024A7EF53